MNAIGTSSSDKPPVVTPVSSDQSWLERSGRRANQRLLPMEYSAHENNAPNAHSRPIRRCRQGVPRCSDISASQPTIATPSTHRPNAGSNGFNGTAPCSRTPTRVTTTGIRPTINEAAAPPAHCTAVANSRKYTRLPARLSHNRPIHSARPSFGAKRFQRGSSRTTAIRP
ncbi:hypothetical protein D3C72_1773580 [compost metagenome]